MTPEGKKDIHVHLKVTPSPGESAMQTNVDRTWREIGVASYKGSQPMQRGTCNSIYLHRLDPVVLVLLLLATLLAALEMLEVLGEVWSLKAASASISLI